MRLTIPRIMVMFMTTTALAQTVDWSNFNSSLVIEVTRPEGKFTCSGVAIKDDVVLTAAHCLEGKILKIRVFNQESYNPTAKSWKVEHFELHPDYNKSESNFKSDLARIKLSSKLPASTTIYPIMKNSKVNFYVLVTERVHIQISERLSLRYSSRSKLKTKFWSWMICIHTLEIRVDRSLFNAMARCILWPFTLPSHMDQRVNSLITR